MLTEVMSIVDEIGSKPVAQSLLEVAAGLSASAGAYADAARLLGAAETQAAETGLHPDPADEAFLAPLIDTMRQALDGGELDAARNAGRSLDYAQAMAYVRRWLAASTATP